VTEEWLTIYNTERPHEALNNMTPNEYKTLR
ncbi:integrase core domain-containing protein, partial [Snodgrassella communis]